MFEKTKDKEKVHRQTDKDKRGTVTNTMRDSEKAMRDREITEGTRKWFLKEPLVLSIKALLER